MFFVMAELTCQSSKTHSILKEITLTIQKMPALDCDPTDVQKQTYFMPLAYLESL